MDDPTKIKTTRTPSQKMGIVEYSRRLKELPERMQHYLLFEAPIPFDPASIKTFMEDGFAAGANLDQVIEALRQDMRNDLKQLMEQQAREHRLRGRNPSDQ